MRKYIGALLLSGALLTPAVVRADDHRPTTRVLRYYDLDGRDYHRWNAKEERAFRHWLEKERRQAYRQYRKANKRQQREYWRWRHATPDWR